MGVILELAGRASEDGGHPDIHRMDENYVNLNANPGVTRNFAVKIQCAYELSAYGGSPPLGLDVEIPATSGNFIHWNNHYGRLRFVSPVDGNISVTNPGAAAAQAFITCIQLT